jgi:hypothetical protein
MNETRSDQAKPRDTPERPSDPGRFSLASSGRSAHDATSRMLSATAVCIIPRVT